MNQQKRIFKGTMLAILAGIFWGISGIFGQLFFQTYHGNPLWITSVRLLIASIILLSYSFYQNRAHFFDIWRDKHNHPIFLLYCIGGIFSVQFFYYSTIKESSSATATILQYTAPVFIMLFLAIWDKKWPKWQAIILVLLAMVGVFLLVTNGNFHSFSVRPIAIITGLITALAVVIYSLAPVNMLQRYGSVNVAGWGMLVAGIMCNIVYPFWRVDFPLTIGAITDAFAIGLIGTALAFLLWLGAIKLVSPLVVTVATATEPLTSVLVSIPLFGLHLTIVSLGAIALVLVSVVLLAIQQTPANQ